MSFVRKPQKGRASLTSMTLHAGGHPLQFIPGKQRFVAPSPLPGNHRRRLPEVSSRRPVRRPTEGQVFTSR